MNNTTLNNITLWEEKNLIEPLTKYENNGEPEESVIILNIPTKLNEKKENDIIDRKKLKRREKEKRRYHRRKSDPIYIQKRREKGRSRKRRIYSNPTLLNKLKEYRKQYKKIHYFKHTREKLNERIKNCYKITALELWSIAKKQKLICPLSGVKLTRDNISVDHIIPVCDGGTNHPSNLRFIDLNANIAKSSMNDKELYELARRIVNTMEKRIV
jgi:hypothetical protein